MLTSVSRIGTVQRTYFENGALKSERMIPGSPPGMLADSMRFTYDSVGRLQRIAWQNGDSLMYWMRRTGDLDSMRVWWVTDGSQRSEIWKFTWDSLGRRRSIIYPYASMTATWHYDRAGTVRRVLSDNASGVVTNRFKATFAQDSVDVTGRVIGQYTYCDTNYDPGVTAGMTCQGWLPDRSSNRFNRLGAMVIQRQDVTTDTLWYDQSGNRTAAKNNTLIQQYTIGSASNRLVSQKDSLRGAIYATSRDYVYAADGGMWERHSVTPSGPDVRQQWQYDNLGRLVGRGEISNLGARDTSWNTCRWDGTGRSAQPCNGFQSTFVGPNVVRTSNGWFFVQAPGIDEPLLLIFRNPNTWQLQKRLQAVTDGAGQLIAIADSAGEIDASYAGSGYGQSSWRGAGVMTRGQTFSPRRWETDAQWGQLQQFRNRAYDPGTGRWLQEDPIGVAGGINLYEYNGNNPATWRDPFGLDPCLMARARKLGYLACALVEFAGQALENRGVQVPSGIAPEVLGTSKDALSPVLRGAKWVSGIQNTGGPAPKSIEKIAEMIGPSAAGTGIGGKALRFVGPAAIIVGAIEFLVPPTQRAYRGITCIVESCVNSPLAPRIPGPTIGPRP
ncbi:MAG: RHS repeat-associated core domain-containing protein [Gemmatimonadales bacterium]